VSPISGLPQMMERGPSRSRFRVFALLVAASLLAGCSNQFGFGITELPAERGWQPLPIGAWVLNDGLAAKAMSFCPRQTCTRQGFAALITFEGREADALERMLATDPARLARDFAKPAAPDKTKTKAAAKAKPANSRPTSPKSTTTVTPYTDGDAKGLLVEIRALGDNGKRAATAILSGRAGPTLVVAIGVSTDPDSARSQARAAWHDR
jgi:hypothetical protein